MGFNPFHPSLQFLLLLLDPSGVSHPTTGQLLSYLQFNWQCGMRNRRMNDHESTVWWEGRMTMFDSPRKEERSKRGEEEEEEEEERKRRRGRRTLCTLAKLTSITVDCSLNHSKSSIVSSRFLFAATSFPLKSDIASGRGYINIVFAFHQLKSIPPSHYSRRQTWR